MAFFWQKDWNVVAITFESSERLRINGNRERGRRAVEAKNGAAAHSGTICWIVFDQKGRRVDGGLGPASKKLPTSEAQQMLDRLPTHKVVLKILHDLEQGQSRSAAIFRWKEN